ncbi:hypothetical protein ACLB2K_046796 [Fragaria x ananassa]
MEDRSGLRKGTWTREEDNILRQCVAKHGEGKWHQIPAAAGDEVFINDPIHELRKNTSTALPRSSASPKQQEIDWVKAFLDEDPEVDESIQTTTS